MADMYANILIFSCSGGYKNLNFFFKACDFEAAEQIESAFYFREKLDNFW